MKKFSTIIMAIALVLGLAYCKKQETPATPDADINWVRITMRVEGGGRDMDTVFPGTGAVVYENGDIIYVGNDTVYRGKLVYQDGMFSGLVADPIVGKHLDFYYLGELTSSNRLPLVNGKDSLAINRTKSFTVSIANQLSGLNILSYGQSTEPFINETTAYTCMLENKCGLVRFILPEVPSTTNDTVTISGMKTTAVVIFAPQNAGITTTETTGVVTLHKHIGSDPKERWAILLPQGETEATVTYYIDGDSGPIEQTIQIHLPAIEANSFYNGYQVIPVKSL